MKATKTKRWVKGGVLLGAGILLFFAFFYGTPRKVDRADLLAYLENPENGLTHSQTFGEHQVQLSYFPSALMRGENFDNFLYFNLKMSYQGRDITEKFLYDENAYAQAHQWMAFSLRNQTYLTAGKDTLYPLDAIYQRSYGMSNHARTLLVFEKNDWPKKPFRFHLNEFGLGTGSCVFAFEPAAFSDVPQLKNK